MSVSTQEITEARADLEAELLPDEAAILRPVEESDGGGGQAVTEWQTRETVPARLDPYGGASSTRGAGGESARHAADRLDTRTSHFLAVAAKTDLQSKDRVEVDGTTYEVNVLRQRGEWELLLRAEVREVF